MADRNRKRRERAKSRKTNAKRAESATAAAAAIETDVPALHNASLNDPVGMSGAVAVAIGDAMDEDEHVQV